MLRKIGTSFHPSLSGNVFQNSKLLNVSEHSRAHMCAFVTVYSQHVLLILYIYLVIHVHLWEFSRCFQTVDCCKDSVADLDFSSKFTLCVDRDCVIYALIGYFDTAFDTQRYNSTKVLIFNTLTHRSEQNYVIMYALLTVIKGLRKRPGVKLQ